MALVKFRLECVNNAFISNENTKKKQKKTNKSIILLYFNTIIMVNVIKLKKKFDVNLLKLKKKRIAKRKVKQTSLALS